MRTTWRAIIDVTWDAGKRCCVFCGGGSGSVHKTASVDEVYALLDGQGALAGDGLHCTYHNLCMSLLAVPGARPGPMYEKFAACACCQHWVGKRAVRPRFLFPLQALQLHFRSMPYVEGKQLDTRVVHRMSAALAGTTGGRSNFFRSAFSEQELALCARIAAGTVSDVTPQVAAFVFEENARPPFLLDARLTVLVREGL